MPWKNGLGITHEIFIDPPDSTLSQNNFHYRISSAHIESDSPFSTFKDKKRWLVIYDGEGMKLNHEKLMPLEAKHFSGEENIMGELLNGSIKDLGIIYDPKIVIVEMSIIHHSNEINLKDVNIFFCVGKEATLLNHHLHHEDSLILKSTGLTSVNLSKETKLIWIALSYV